MGMKKDQDWGAHSQSIYRDLTHLPGKLLQTEAPRAWPTHFWGCGFTGELPSIQCHALLMPYASQLPEARRILLYSVELQNQVLLGVH